jgi:hypothetical protein
MRKLVSSGSPFEPRIGFARAVRVGHVGGDSIVIAMEPSQRGRMPLWNP